MANIFVSSDPHFGCNGSLKHLNWRGERMRKFDSVQEMDAFIISEHNKRVNTSDKWYCLGDVALKRLAIATAGGCNGHGRLLRGNHDIYKTKDYLAVFEEIYATRYMEPAFPGDVTLLFSHYPIHPNSIKPAWVNVHGHVHDSIKPGSLGPKYLNLCLDAHAFRPLAIEEIRVLARKQMVDADLHP
jgi:calcineurin-like phosphoesterase family protein